MGRKVYDLLSIDVVFSWKRRKQALLKDGVIFNNCIFTGHGNSGVIWLGSDTITRFWRRRRVRCWAMPAAAPLAGRPQGSARLFQAMKDTCGEIPRP